MTVKEQTPEDTQVVADLTVETVEDEAAALAAFDSGFTGKEPENTEPEPVTPTDEPAVVTSEEAKEEPHVEEPPQPKVATVTEEQLAQLLAAANSIGDVRAAVEKVRSDAFGRMGGIERLIKSLQEATPEGAAIEVTQDDVKEVAEEYELLAPRLAQSLTRVLAKVKGTGKSTVVPSLTQEEIDQRIESRANEIAGTIATREGQRVYEAMLGNQLALLHRDWRTVVGPKDSDTEFRRWLKTDPKKEQDVLASQDPFYIADVITEFKQHKEKQETPKPKPRGTDTRSQRLAEAVPVKGGGGKPPMPRQKTDLELFEEGFTENARR